MKLEEKQLVESAFKEFGKAILGLFLAMVGTVGFVSVIFFLMS